MKNLMRSLAMCIGFVLTATFAQAQLRATYTVVLQSRYFWTNDGDASGGPDPRWIFWIQDNVDGNRLGQTGTLSNDGVSNNSDLTFATNHNFGSRTNTATRIDTWLNCWEEDSPFTDDGRSNDRDIADVTFRDEDGGYNTSTRYPSSGEYRTSVSDGGSFRYGGVYLVTWRFAETCPAPTGLTATDAGASNISISWNAANQAERYDVYRDGNLIGNTTGISFTDSTTTRGTTYTYSVRAYREGSNFLVKSDTLSGFSNTDTGLWPKLSQTITITAPTTKTYGDAGFAPGATASSGLAVSYSIVSGPATIVSNNIRITGAGIVNVRASQAGDASYNAAPNVDRSFSVNPKSLTIAAVGKSKVYGSVDPALTYTVAGLIGTDGLTGVLERAVGEDAGIYAIGQGTLTAGGNYSISFTPADFTIQKADQTISFPNIPGKSTVDAPFSVSASSSSGLPVTLTSLDPMVATVSGNTVTIVGAGTATLRASQGGNINYNAAPNVDQALTVSPPPNLQPTFAGMTVKALVNTSVNVLEAKILARAADPESEPISIFSVATASAQAGTLTRIGGIIIYSPQSGFVGADSFAVTLSDGENQTVFPINVDVVTDPLFTSPANAPRLTALAGGAMRISFNGIPGRTYAIQRSTTMQEGSWEQIAPVTAAPNSTVTYDDPNPPQPASFYRIAYPAQ